MLVQSSHSEIAPAALFCGFQKGALTMYNCRLDFLLESKVKFRAKAKSGTKIVQRFSSAHLAKTRLSRNSNFRF